MTNVQSSSDAQGLLIRASAGTGKTFRLTNRYLKLLIDGVEPHDILAVTFTRKAAGEIFERVLKRLAEAAVDEKACQELATSLDKELTPAKCAALVARTTRQLHRLRIGTLDSFFARIASSFSLELGLPPDWQIASVLEDETLRRAAIEQMLTNEAPADVQTLLLSLTKDEARRSISRRIRDTVEDLYTIFQTTEEKAWDLPVIRAPTPDKVAVAIQRLADVSFSDKRFVNARDGDVKRALAGDWREFVGAGIAAKVLAQETTYYKKEIPSDVMADYELLLSQARAVLVGELAQRTKGTYTLLAQFDHTYQAVKKQFRWLRFEDVTRSVRDLEQFGGVDRVAFRLDAPINHLLLDEFQDTSPDQWEVLRPFAEWTMEADKARSFFCVGDVKQAIYGWRGGEAELFDAIDQELDGVVSESMDQTYRSAPDVIATVNQVFTGASRHPNLDRAESAVADWCRRYRPQESKRPNLAGFASLLTAPLAGEGEKQGEVTARCAAEQVAALSRQAPQHSIGVLVRTNRALAQMIFLLRQLDVPASEEGGSALTDAASVHLMLSAMRLADHPGDTVARYHLAHSPIAEVLGLKDANGGVRAVYVAQSIRKQLVCDGYGTVVRRWSDVLAPYCTRHEESRLQQLVGLAYDYEGKATLRTDDFIDFIGEQKVSDPSEVRVRVMTIHQSKGLEFDMVVLPELDVSLTGSTTPAFVTKRPTPTAPVERVCRYANDKVQQVLPEVLQAMFAATTGRTVQESLSVLYVALTRPKHALHIIIAPAKNAEKEKKIPATMAGLLRVALAEGELALPSTVLFKRGEPDWAAAATFAEGMPLMPERMQIVRPVWPAVKGGSGRRRNLEHIAPSSLEGGVGRGVGDVLRSEPSASLLRGSIVHSLFGLIHWLEDGPPTVGQLDAVTAKFLHQPEFAALDLAALLTEFRDLLEYPFVDGLLREATYRDPVGSPLLSQIPSTADLANLRLEVHNEFPFAVRDERGLINGSIDRLILILDSERVIAAEVLDYKTDTWAINSPEVEGEKVDFYRAQIDAYRRVVTIMTGLEAEQIACRLLFVCQGKVVVV